MQGKPSYIFNERCNKLYLNSNFLSSLSYHATGTQCRPDSINNSLTRIDVADELCFAL